MLQVTLELACRVRGALQPAYIRWDISPGYVLYPCVVSFGVSAAVRSRYTPLPDLSLSFPFILNHCQPAMYIIRQAVLLLPPILFCNF